MVLRPYDVNMESAHYDPEVLGFPCGSVKRDRDRALLTECKMYPPLVCIIAITSVLLTTASTTSSHVESTPIFLMNRLEMIRKGLSLTALFLSETDLRAGAFALFDFGVDDRHVVAMRATVIMVHLETTPSPSPFRVRPSIASVSIVGCPASCGRSDPRCC